MPFPFEQEQTKMPVSTADLALKDLQEKRSRFDEISRGMQLQSMRKAQKGSYVKPVEQKPFQQYG